MVVGSVPGGSLPLRLPGDAVAGDADDRGDAVLAFGPAGVGSLPSGWTPWSRPLASLFPLVVPATLLAVVVVALGDEEATE